MSRDIPARSLHATAEKVAAHAELVKDFNPLHLDPDFAAQTPFGGPIVHGSLMMNLLVDTLERAGGADFVNGTLRLRFAAPAPVGAVLTAGGAASSEAAGVYDVWVRREDGTTVVSGTLVPAGHGAAPQ
jgi:acyl dehydratase